MDANVFDVFGLSDKIYSNNNNLLIEIINELRGLTNIFKNHLIIVKLNNVITKIKNIINENMKNTKLIRNSITKMYTKINEKSIELQVNKSQELLDESGRYVGQVVNGWSKRRKRDLLYE